MTNDNNNNNNIVLEPEPSFVFAPLPAMPGISEDFKKRIGNLFLKINILRHFVAPLARNRESLSRFGMKTSTTLRAHFYRLAEAYGLTPESILWVYLFCAKARTKDRIKAGIKTLPDNLTQDPHFKNAARFLEAKMVTWPDQETEERFATVHLPNTNPGLAFLMVVLTDPKITEEEFLRNTWAPQINWHSEYATKVKTESEFFWTQVVTHTTHTNRRTKRPEDTRFNLGIFETQMKDQYPLLAFNVKSGELEPFLAGGPYKKADLDAYLEWAKGLEGLMASKASEPPAPPSGPGSAQKRQSRAKGMEGEEPGPPNRKNRRGSRSRSRSPINFTAPVSPATLAAMDPVDREIYEKELALAETIRRGKQEEEKESDS